MAGTFELFQDGDMSFGFRLKAPDGTVVAVYLDSSGTKRRLSRVSAPSVSMREWV